MLKQFFVFGLMALVLGSQPVLLSAQVADRSDWGAVRGLSSGEKLRVETCDGKSISGDLSSVSDADVQVSRKGRVETVRREDVRKVYRGGGGGSLGRSIGIFAAIGAGVGLGVAAGLLAGTGGSDSSGAILATGAAVGAGAGAAVGGAVGSGKRVLIYEAR